jgi:drug/metabolite transporter (DMT)-like permease
MVLMTLGMLGFAVEDVFIKLAAERIPPGQIILVVGASGALLFALLARSQGLRLSSRAGLHPAVLGRNAFEMMGTFFYVLALALAPLVVVSAIFQAMPLAVTMGAALVLGEAVGWRRWSAIAVGFLGVMVVIRPWGAAFEPASLLALGAVVGLAGRDLCTRRVPEGTPSYLLAGWGSLAVALVGAVQLLFTGGAVWPTGPEALWLLGALGFGAAGYWVLTEATRVGELSAVMPFRYARLLFALLLGFLVFAERPDAWTLVGAALIIGSGLYAFARERRRRLSPAVPPR